MDFLEEKVKSVEEVFERLDTAISQFQSKTSLHCEHGCGKCCFKPTITASVLEFLPFAFHLYKSKKAQEWYYKLKNNTSGICVILHPNQAGAGLCSQYKHRGLICRLFGYSARTDKYGAREMVTCQIIKTGQEEKFNEAEKNIAEGMEVPVMRDYYLQMASIDFDLANENYPINEAIRKAIETVLAHYAYLN